MTKRRLGTVALLVVAAVLVLGGCGGSKRLSKEEFAAKADALCVRYRAQLPAAPENTAPAIVAYFKKLIPLDTTLIADLKKLKPPADEEATVKQAIALDEQQLARAKALVAALTKNDIAKANKLIEEAAGNAKQARALFAKLGSSKCRKS